jgi:hypothetical protein
MFRPSDSLKKLTIFLGKELSYNQFDGIYLFLSERTRLIQLTGNNFVD